MLQQRQIVNALGKQIDIEDPDGMKYAIISFHYLDWRLLISVNVTIYRTAILHRYQSSSHWIMIVTAKLWSGIKL